MRHTGKFVRVLQMGKTRACYSRLSGCSVVLVVVWRAWKRCWWWACRSWAHGGGVEIKGR